MSDLGGAEAGQDLQGESDLRLDGKRRVASCEHHAEEVAADLALEGEGHIRLGRSWDASVHAGAHGYNAVAS